jgi:hypothetical protein
VKKLFAIYFLIFCGILQTQIITAAPSMPLVDSLSQRITRIEQENTNLRLKVEYLDKLYEKRFDDFTKWLGIVIALIAAGTVLGIVNANNVARKQAIEELEKLQEKIKSLENEAAELSRTVSSTATEFQLLSQFQQQNPDNPND